MSENERPLDSRSWTPTEPRPNPFVTSGAPGYIGGRFTERQQLVDWVHSFERNSLLIGGVRGSGKTTLTTWLADYVAFDPHEHFKTRPTPEAVFLRGNRSGSLASQLTSGLSSTVTSEMSAAVFGLRGGRTESVTTSPVTSLLELMPHNYLLVIDEAQSLDHDQLVEIAEYLETPGSEYSGKVLMVGTPHLFHMHPPDGTFGLFARCPRISLQATQTLEEVADTITGTTKLDDHPKHFTDDAIGRIHQLSGGYPTTVQLAGYYAYRTNDTTIDVDQIERSFERDTFKHLKNVFDQMVRRQGPVGRKPVLRRLVLETIAKGGAITAGEIATQLGKQDSRHISPALDHLQQNGLAELGVDHHWRICVPLLDRYVLENPN